MNQLSEIDLPFVVRRIPKDIRILMVERGLYVGGGFIRETISGGTPKDIDILGSDKGQLDAAANALSHTRGVEGAKTRLHRTENAITLLTPPRLPVQFITRWVFTQPEALVSSFDFTMCQVAIWYDPAKGAFTSMCSDCFYEDLAARRLVYTSPKREEEAGGSMMRVIKFVARGWNIQPTSLAAVIARVANKVNWGKAGSEERAAFVIRGLLREVDPLLVIDGIDPIDEHGKEPR